MADPFPQRKGFSVNVHGLVQLSSLHDTSYGYSFGIEKMARNGRLSNPDQLALLVKGVLLASIGPADGVASGVAFRAARTGDFEQLPELCSVMSSDRVPATLRLASLHMGQRLWGLSRAWDWAAAIHQQLDPLAQKTDLHHAVAFGALVSETTSNQVRAIATYLFNIARGIVTAAVHAASEAPPPRLDEAAGQRVLSDMQPTITQLAAACADRQPTDILAINMGEDPLRSIFP
jgi:urease accessory protein UreF